MYLVCDRCGCRFRPAQPQAVCWDCVEDKQMSQSQGSIEQLYLLADRPIDNHDKLRCVTRELELRRLNYPAQIRAGRIMPARAQYEIKVMETIVKDYQQALIKQGGDQA